ncbi:MAG: NAD(P)-dependent glycerol-3-phosphate dehydrogenase [Pyrinomonadaceae bacterium MAG19_C2-C3]|nr:NAD(P)-dependent glycerol-3-phosphate dehydrogenase [Pyrinomonadaceae bacterium MAG19_C2-C3]
MKRITIVGAGSWGTALGLVAARGGHDVRLWTRSKDNADYINREHRHPTFLEGVAIPANVRATNDLNEAIDDAGTIVIAVPSHTVRQVVHSMDNRIKPHTLLVSATKGIEVETGMRVSQILEATLSDNVKQRFVCLSGPSFAKEVAVNQPTAVVAASQSEAAGGEIQEMFSVGNFRVYTNDDVVGTELCGAVKNTMAIAAGIIVGLGLGTNSVAGLVTRGLTEMMRFAVAHGAKGETLMGLAGLGDLVLTCTGASSRNRYVGEQLGRGKSLAAILAGMKEVAEGVRTTRAVMLMAERAGIEMPITTEVDAVLYRDEKVAEAIKRLMQRPLRQEVDEPE